MFWKIVIWIDSNNWKIVFVCYGALIVWLFGYGIRTSYRGWKELKKLEAQIEGWRKDRDTFEKLVK